MNVGAVGCLRSIKNAIGVARRVLDNTEHSFLVGDLASDFAVKMGFTKESLETNTSHSVRATAYLYALIFKSVSEVPEL